MNYGESIRYIKGTAAFGSRLGLDNIRKLLSFLGNPQNKLRFIHIAGTNGKGSVASYMLSVLEKSGYRTGFYTSPELYRFSERIRINEEEIPEGDVAVYATRIKEASDYMISHDLGRPTEFELVLAMALCYFLDNKADPVILETGLGGRLDATNIIENSIISVITKISRDHMQYLGDTLPEIAGEKAAIIKPGGTVIVYPSVPDVMQVFSDECRVKNARLITAYLPEKGDASLEEDQSFDLFGKTYTTTMKGLYETENAALAIQAFKAAGKTLGSVTEESIREGISTAVWPARFEVLAKNPYVIIDGAHNEDGARALSASLKRYFGKTKVTLCIGILKDKEYEKMLKILLPHAGEVAVCEVPNTRTLKASDLKEVIHGINPDMEVSCYDSYKDLCAEIKKLRNISAAVVICGSLYLAGPLREELLRH